MTLEDFFTLAEIKDGLTVTSRVEELVSVMQSNKDLILKNAGDASRQWAAVASTILATKNRECLDVFVNLDGHRYLSNWLAAAQMLTNDSIDRSLEEAILALLGALGNLGVDSSKLVSSGILVAVKKLVDHGSSQIQDQARKLLDNWKDKEVFDHSDRDSESCSKIHEDEMRVVAASKESSGQKSVLSLCSARSNNEKENEALPSGSLAEINPDQDKGSVLQNDKVGIESNVSHCSSMMPENLNDSSTDHIMKDDDENLSVKGESSMREESGPTNFGIVSSDSIVASMEIEKTSLKQSSLDSNEVSRNAIETISGSHDASITHNSKDVSSFSHAKENQNLDNSSGGNGRNREVESDNVTAHGDNEGRKDEKSRVKRRKKRRSSRSMTVSQCLGAMDKTSADIELGILDALEVATKVAQEVAREVDSGEPSSEELSDESSSQDCREDAGSPSKGVSVAENHSLEEPQVGGSNDIMDEKIKKSENEMMNSDDVEETRLAAAATAKSEVVRENNSPCVDFEFDLNQDIFPDETDVVMSSISTNAAPATAPSQFERSLSSAAATSGESKEKQVICRGIDLNVAEVGDDQIEELTPWKQFPFLSSSNSKGGESSNEVNHLKGSSRFNLDLNCTNEDDDMPPPPSSELKMETRLFLSHNGQQSASPTSSSLSVSQQSGKEVNFDLNDRPQFFLDSRDQVGPYSGRHPYGGLKLEEPAISIFGTKMDIDRKENVSQMASFLSTGKSIEPATGLYMGRSGNSLGLASGVSISPSPIYGYNGLVPPPFLSSSPMYAPYIMDPRGNPVMMPTYAQPQPPFPQQHMFMSLASGSPPNLNGSVRPNFDQSCGFGIEIGGNNREREPLSLRQFLSPEQSVAMGEHSGANAEASSSSSISVGGKRKEPETTTTRWEFPPWR